VNGLGRHERRPAGRAGGTLHHKELLAPFNLDDADPAFWSNGLGVIQGFIDGREALG
jgi:oligoendopeptidase F